MILRKLTWLLLRMLRRYIRRQIVTRILDYCRRAGWTEKEIHFRQFTSSELSQCQ